MKSGRNDPCPCGSGKKYKHCCLAVERQAAESPSDLAWRRVRRAIDGFAVRLQTFINETYGVAAVGEAWNEFSLFDSGDLDPESPLCAIFFPWMYHCWAPDPFEEFSEVDPALHDRQPTSLYLERRGSRLDPILRRYLEACLSTPFSFYEIVNSDPGRGFRARDLITDAEYEVLDRSASAAMAAGDILYGQLVAIEGIVLLEACSPYALGPADKLLVIDLRETMATGSTRDLPPREWLRAWDIELREIYLTAVRRFLDPMPPVVHNTDGELFQPQRLIFEIDSAETAFAGLRHLAAGMTADDVQADAERDADGNLVSIRFSWMKAGNPMHASWDNTILGHVKIRPGRLQVDVNSMERADALREIVARNLGSAARYLGGELPQAEASDEDEVVDEDAIDLNELPEVREHLNRFVTAHYEDWMSQEIPALGNRRPVDIVESAAGREKVDALLRQMERDSSRMEHAPDEAIFRKLRERLGLDS